MRNMKDARIRQWPATAPKEIRLSSAGVGSISEHEAKLGPLAVLNYVDVYVTCVCVCVPVRIVHVHIVRMLFVHVSV